jgi:hypothetical protein
LSITKDITTSNSIALTADHIVYDHLHQYVDELYNSAIIQDTTNLNAITQQILFTTTYINMLVNSITQQIVLSIIMQGHYKFYVDEES